MSLSKFQAGVWWSALLVGAGLFGQSKEMIRFGNRIVAIESLPPSFGLNTGAQGNATFSGVPVTISAFDPNGQPISVTWTPQSGLVPASHGKSAVFTPPTGSTNYTIQASKDGTNRSITIQVGSASVSVGVSGVSGQPGVYQALATSGAVSQVEADKWNWSVTPSNGGSISPQTGTNSYLANFSAPVANYCAQTVTLSATARKSGTDAQGAPTLIPLGIGQTSFSVPQTALASLPNAQAGFSTSVTSGNSVDLVAALPNFNCAAGANWSWSGPNVSQVGSSWKFQAPSGISSNTNYSVTATELNSNKSTTFTITVVPASAATVTVSPNPISLWPYGRVLLTATTGASNPSYNWSHVGGGGLLATTGSSVCFDAGPATSGTAQVTAAMTSAQGGANGTASIQFSTTGPNQRPAPTLTIYPENGALNLTQGIQLAADPKDGCGSVPLVWEKVSGPGTVSVSGYYTPPGSVAANTSLVVKATRSGTSVYASKTYTHSTSSTIVTVSPDQETVQAGGQSLQMSAVRSDHAVQQQFNWTVQPGGYGVTVTNLGLFIPPSTLDLPRNFEVKATSVISPLPSGTAIIRVNTTCTPVLQLSASPTLLGPGNVSTLAVTNTCPGNWTYNWSKISGDGTLGGGNAATNSLTAPGSISGESATIVRVTLRDSLGNASDYFREVSLTLRPLIVVSVNPTTATAYKGQMRNFSASLQNVPSGQSNAVIWTVEPGGVGGINSSSGVYTAPTTISSAQTLTIRGTSVADNTRSGTAQLSLIPVSVAISGPTTLATAASHTYSATVSGSSNTSYTWDPVSSSHATFAHATGQLTVNSNLSSTQTITLTARSVDENKTASITVTLTPAPGVYNIQPIPTTVFYMQSQTFTGQTVGLGSPPITWGVSASDGISPGYINSQTGQYMATVPAMSGPRTVTVTGYAEGYYRSANFTIRPGLEPTGVTPTGAGPAQQTFSVAVQANAGLNVLQQVWFLVGTPGVTGGQCKVMRDRVSGEVKLEADNGINMLTVPAGSSTANSQCRLYHSGTGESVSGSTVTTTFNVQFLNYYGSKGLHVFPIGSNNHGTGGWVNMGNYTPPTPSVTISISPNTQQTLQGGQTKAYTASVNTGSVTWELSSAVGTLSSASGLSTTYNAPASISTNQYITITARSTVDTTKTASATIYLSNVPPPPTLISLTPLNGSGANPTFVAVFGGMPSGTNANIRFAVASGPNDLFNVGSCTLDFSGPVQSPLYATLNPHPGFVQWSYTAGGNPTYYMYNSFCNTGGNSITTSLSGSQFTLSMNLWFSTYYPEYKRVYINYGGTLIDMGSWTTQ